MCFNRRLMYFFLVNSVFINMFIFCGSTDNYTVTPLPGNSSVAGVFVDSIGNPAVQADVFLYPTDYVAPISSTINHLGKRLVPDNNIRRTTTDNQGKYHFDSIPDGIYSIECNKDNCLYAFIDSVIVENSSNNVITNVNTDTLREASVILGSIDWMIDSVQVYVRAIGIARIANVDTNGNYILKNMPEGKYELQFVTVQRDTITIDTSKYITVQTNSGDTSIIGPSFVTLIYNGNNNTAGNPPSSVTTRYGSQVILSGQGTLNRNGYIFSGWNNTADGSGTRRNPGDTMVIDTEAVVVYAQWKRIEYTVRFNTQGGSETLLQLVASGAHVIEPAKPNLTGYTFGGWFKEAVCLNAWNFAVDTVITDTTLFAKWDINHLLTPVVYFPFNGNANDQSANHYNGIVNGAILTSDRHENPNSAYMFDGIDDYITVSDTEQLGLTGAFSISVWFKAIDVLPYASIICKSMPNDPRRGYCISIDPDKKVRADAIYDHSQNNQGTVLSDTILLDNNWHHIAVVYDTINLKLYIDGTLNNAIVYESGIQPNTEPLLIGWDQNTYLSHRHFKGAIDDIRIFDQVLSETEIVELYKE